ncbi:MAG: AAA family ATPase [Colwellia sp.]|nr:AAA family ATPase [Colwellia sp.]
MNKESLTPNEHDEFRLVKYSMDLMVDGKANKDFSDLLYHKRPLDLMKRILKGEDLSLDLTVPEPFAEAYLSDTQASRLENHLIDLSNRRGHLESTLKSVFNEEADYSNELGKVLSFSDIQDKMLDQMKNNPIGMSHGCWRDFESVVGGFHAGDVVGIAGGSGAGKTTLALQWIDLLQRTYPSSKSGFISIEMSPEALAKKITRLAQGIRTTDLIHYATNKPEQITKFNYGGWANCSFAHMTYSLKEISDFVQREKPKFFVIDHLNLIAKEKGYSQGDWSMYFVGMLKKLCKRFGCVCFLLIQFDKTAMRKDKDGKRRIPTLEDAYGGIGVKANLDHGVVVYKNDDNERLIYWDKVREVYKGRHLEDHFKMLCDPEVGIVELELQIENEGIFDE